jgi:hypothetical protein
MTTADTYDLASARVAAVDALAAWARRRDQLPEDRARLLALAWHTGSRSIVDLARAADVSRDTVYADLKSMGIDHRDRAAAPVPQYQPLHANTVRALAELAHTRLLSSMIGGRDRENPLATAAWQVQIALHRIADLLDPEHDAGESRLDGFADLADRGGLITTLAHQAMAAEITREVLAARAENDAILSLGESAPVVDAATLTVALPRGTTIQVEVSTRDSGTWTVRSASPDLVGQLDAAAHLDVGSAMALIAAAIAPALSDDAVDPD